MREVRKALEAGEFLKSMGYTSQKEQRHTLRNIKFMSDLERFALSVCLLSLCVYSLSVSSLCDFMLCLILLTCGCHKHLQRAPDAFCIRSQAVRK
jgi:hypothetical protein